MLISARRVLVEDKFRPKCATLKGLYKEMYNSNLNQIKQGDCCDPGCYQYIYIHNEN